MKEGHVGQILLVTDHIANSTSSKEITRKKLLPKEQYLTQRVRAAYIASMCQPEISFDFFEAAQIVAFLSDDIVLLNKWLQ